MWRAAQSILSKGLRTINEWRTQKQICALQNELGGTSVTVSSSEEQSGAKSSQKGEQHSKRSSLFLSSLAEAVGWSTAAVLGWQLSQPLSGSRDGTRHQENGSMWRLLYNIALSQPDQKSHILPQKQCKTKQNPAEKHQASAEESDVFITEEARELRRLQDQIVMEYSNEAGVALSSENPSEAFTCYQTSAALGCSRAMFNLGVCYELGLGTKQSFSEAAVWYQRAVDKGHHTAMYNLGLYYLEGREGVPVDGDKAVLLLTQAASSGMSEAQTVLQVLFSPRTCAHPEYTDTDRKYYAGLSREHGWGLKEDKDVAAELLSSAAMAGHTNALYELGNKYERGTSRLTQDPYFAMQLYGLAAGQGHQAAEGQLDRLRAYDAIGCLKDVVSQNSCGIKKSKSSPMLQQNDRNRLAGTIIDRLDLWLGERSSHGPVFAVGDDARLTSPALV